MSTLFFALACVVLSLVVARAWTADDKKERQKGSSLWRRAPVGRAQQQYGVFSVRAESKGPCGKGALPGRKNPRFRCAKADPCFSCIVVTVSKRFLCVCFLDASNLSFYFFPLFSPFARNFCRIGNAIRTDREQPVLEHFSFRLVFGQWARFDSPNATLSKPSGLNAPVSRISFRRLLGKLVRKAVSGQGYIAVKEAKTVKLHAVF